MIKNDLNDDTDPESQCYKEIPEYADYRATAKFWISGVLLPVFGGIGLLGNVMSIFVICYGSKPNNFDILLYW